MVFPQTGNTEKFGNSRNRGNNGDYQKVDSLLRDSLDTGGDFSGQNQGNADCSNVANFDSIVSFFLQKMRAARPQLLGTKMKRLVCLCGRFKESHCHRAWPSRAQKSPRVSRLSLINIDPLIDILEGYLEGYQRTASPRPEGELLPIAYRIAPLNGRLK